MRTPPKTPCALALSLLLLTCVHAHGRPEWLLLLDLDSAESNVKAGVGSRGSVEFVPGVVDQAMHLGAGAQATVAAEGHVLAESGTIEFWLTSDWDGNDGKVHELLSLGAKGGMAVMKDADDSLRLVLNRHESEQGASVSLKVTWRRNDWRHVAVSWDKKAATIHLDGRQVNRTKLASPPQAFGSAQLVIGGPGCEAALDDLRISALPLPNEEILAAYVRGAEALEEGKGAYLCARAAVGGSAARLVWDTGCTPNILFWGFLERAGIKASLREDGLGAAFSATLQFPDAPEGRKTVWHSSPQEYNLAFDGILGWQHVLSRNAMAIQWDSRTLRSLGSEAKAPDGGRGWTTFPFDAAGPSLVIEDVAFEVSGVRERVRVAVDTGEPDALMVDAGLWSRLQPELNGRPCSMTSSWNPLDGAAVERSYVFDSVKLFGGELKSVAIGRDRLDRAAPKRDHKPAMRLGLAALSYFDVGFNGPRGTLWLKQRPMPALKPALNLSGVVVMPHVRGAALQLKVDEGTRAWELGLRDGDELLKIDGEPFDDLHGSRRPGLPSRVWDGRPLRVTVRRGGSEVTLSRGTGG